MPRFFIDRPVFATVISVVITLIGGLAIFSLPIAQYPEVVPPQVRVAAAYRGANAHDVEKEELAAKVLPAGFGYEWTGTVYQQRKAEGQEPIIFGLSAILVLLLLAALYESWATPFAVVLSVPLGIFGALVGGVAARICVRCVHADRYRDADRSGGEERHPHRGVRQAAA
jgi:multidrug efflux pump subunit AcrB